MDFNRLNLNWPYLWWLLTVFLIIIFSFPVQYLFFSCVGVGEYVCAKHKCFWLHQKWADAEGFG